MKRFEGWLAAVVLGLAVLAGPISPVQAQTESGVEGAYLWRGQKVSKSMLDVLSYFDQNPASPGSTIIFGGAMAASVPWAEIFPKAPIRTYAVWGTSPSFMRVQLRQITEVRPAHVVVLAGEQWARSLESGTHALVLLQYMLERLKRDAARTKITLVTLPVSAKDQNAGAVKSYNDRLKRLANAFGIGVLDLEQTMTAAEEAGQQLLYRSPTILGAEGMQILSEMLAPQLGACRVCD